MHTESTVLKQFRLIYDKPMEKVSSASPIRRHIGYS